MSAMGTEIPQPCSHSTLLFGQVSFKCSSIAEAGTLLLQKVQTTERIGQVVACETHPCG